MKEYSGNSLYRGQSYDYRVCAKSRKAVAEILDTTVHQIKTYVWDKKIEKDEEFEGILVVAYGSNAVKALGLTSDNLRDEMTFDEFKERVDKYLTEKSKRD